jgi:2'-hydroxyisoflavone reductase
MRILIIGGTAFVGRHMTQAAIDRGHEVTLFNRGKTAASLFPEARHLTGDRNTDLSALAGGSWDATIDVCAYFPRQVRSLAAALDGRGGQQMYISTVSVYRAPVAAGYTEDAPLAELADPETEELTDETYGGLKVVCEREATRLYGADNTTIVRPTYVIGPYDRTYRFTWWMDRLSRGGDVLAPGNPADPMQLIDARDMATWVISMLERSVRGVFHAANPAPPYGFGDMLDAIAAEVAPQGTRLTWVDSAFLRAADTDYAGLPLWSGGDPDEDVLAADPAAAFATGLSPRPLRQTVADIRAEGWQPGSGPPGIGMAADREAELLAMWRSRAT